MTDRENEREKERERERERERETYIMKRCGTAFETFTENGIER